MELFFYARFLDIKRYYIIFNLIRKYVIPLLKLDIFKEKLNNYITRSFPMTLLHYILCQILVYTVNTCYFEFQRKQEKVQNIEKC